MPMYEFFLPLVCFALVATTIPFAAKAALRLGFIDTPDHKGRKHHEKPTARIGGVIVFATALPLMLWLKLVSLPIVISAAILIAVGMIDDRFGTKALLKLAAQIVAASIVVLWAGVKVESLGVIFGQAPVNLDFLSAAFSILCIVLLINAMNMIDGLDGLCAGIGTIALIFLGANWILIAALFGFLLHNIRTPILSQARVFFGDAGSMTLGLMLGVFAINAAQNGDLAPMSVAWILALPIIDCAAVFAKRILSKKSPLSADRGHIHYRIMVHGYGHGQTVAMLLATSATFGAIGLLPFPQWVLALGWIGLLIAHIIFSVIRDTRH